MSDVAVKSRLQTNQVEVSLYGGRYLSGVGMDCEEAGRLLINLDRLYSVFVERIPISVASLEDARTLRDILKEDRDFLVPTSKLSLVSASHGSVSFLLEAALIFQASLVAPLSTAIANFVGVIEALKMLQNLMPGTLKKWDERVIGVDERELNALANIIG